MKKIVLVSILLVLLTLVVIKMCTMPICYTDIPPEILLEQQSDTIHTTKDQTSTNDIVSVLPDIEKPNYEMKEEAHVAPTKPIVSIEPTQSTENHNQNSDNISAPPLKKPLSTSASTNDILPHLKWGRMSYRRRYLIPISIVIAYFAYIKFIEWGQLLSTIATHMLIF